jgi:serine phosphatase RsbU (regulator of sigma subunit)
MPSLILLKAPDGVPAARTIPLTGDAQTIGRDSERCQIVIPHHAVSREHARITAERGQFYIEDGDGRGNRSRNHTFVNSKEVAGPLPLRPDDRIKICDFLFQFRDERVQRPGRLPAWMRKDAPPPEDEDDGGMTTVEATLGGDAGDLLKVAPADRLRAILDISIALSRTLELDPLLALIADTLLATFKQADRCFVLGLDEAGRPFPRAVKGRRPGQDDARFSRTIVRQVLQSMQSFLTEDAAGDPNLGPAASIAEFKIRSVMCVPLADAGGRPLGVIQVDTDRTRKFGADDLSLLTIVANLAGVAVEKARLHEAALAREKEQQEIALARKVLLGFLPQTLPGPGGYEFYAHYSPAQTVGGDYYDFVPLPGGRTAVVLGDVAGKGVPAALLVAKLSSEVKFSLLTEPDPAKAVGLLNDQMIRGGLQDRFVTLAVLVLDPAAHTVTVVNAGHPSPKVYRAARGALADLTPDDDTGPAIGFVPGYRYAASTLALDPGDVVTVFTDGVTDALSPTPAPAGEMYGPARVERCLTPADAALADARPKRTGEALVADVTRHAAGRAQADDIAVVCFGRLEPGHGPSTGTAARPTLSEI